MANTSNLTSNLQGLAARGTGRYYRRIGLDVTQAVSAAANLYPQLSSADVRRGWNAEGSRL